VRVVAPLSETERVTARKPRTSVAVLVMKIRRTVLWEDRRIEHLGADEHQ
jgi:hypothetical protein